MAKEENQAQIFEVETTICKSGKIEFTNLYILAKSLKHIKIPIHNTTGNIIKIPKRTTIGYLSTEVEKQPPDTIPNFSQLCEYPEQLKQMNLKNLDPLQHMQLKMLLNNFTDIFVSKNKFGRTDIIQHQIKFEDTMPIKQKAYRVPLASHEIIQ
ncbi:hypothetical protein G9A89_004315 [Geosiphon pyriformis]|nr:hypothetical protein G9A89_004315 [Geosiphon pyriformis]